MTTSSCLYLFIDASVNAGKNLACGAYLLTDDIKQGIEQYEVNTQLFESNSSSYAELYNLNAALDLLFFETKVETAFENLSLKVFTDSQSIVGLPARRPHLEKNNYCSAKQKPLNNALLYKRFFTLIAPLNIEFIKVKGHKANHTKSHIDSIFALVDKAARRKLRE